MVKYLQKSTLKSTSELEMAEKTDDNRVSRTTEYMEEQGP